MAPPDPGAPAGIGNLGNFIYVGTAKGQIYVTQDGGGSGAGNNWMNISLGLDGSAVTSIIADPTRGSHDAYAVTADGVFYLPDSILLGNNPTNTAYEWVNITGNLTTWLHHLRPDLQPGDRPEPEELLPGCSRCPRSWPTGATPSPTKRPYANGPSVHPVLYVGAGDSFGTGSGVFQSLDGG